MVVYMSDWSITTQETEGAMEVVWDILGECAWLTRQTVLADAVCKTGQHIGVHVGLLDHYTTDRGSLEGGLRLASTHRTAQLPLHTLQQVVSVHQVDLVKHRRQLLQVLVCVFNGLSQNLQITKRGFVNKVVNNTSLPPIFLAW